MTPTAPTERPAAGDLRAGEPAYDLVRNRPVVVTDYLGRLGTVDTALAETVRNAYSNSFVPLQPSTPLYDVIFLGLQSKPSKSYAYPATRLARPRVESHEGWTGREYAEIGFAVELFGAASDEERSLVADLVESVRPESFSSEALSRYVRDGGAREDSADE